MRSFGGDRRGRWGWITLAAALVACGGRGEERTEADDPITPGAEAPVDSDLAEVASDHALATVFFQLQRWPEVRDAIRRALPGQPPEEVQRVLTMPLEQALRETGARRLADALLELRGVDDERPMVLRFAETTGHGLDRVTAAARDGLTPGEDPGGIRHVLAVPATDPTLAERSLRRALAHLCEQEEGELRCFRGWPTRFETDARWVYVVFGEIDAPLRGSGEASGTLRWAMDPRWPAAAYFRHSAMRGAAVHDGLRQMRRAVGYASAEYLEEMTAAGLAEVLAAHSRTADRTPELDEGALALRPDPAALLFVGHLTPRATDALSDAGGDDGAAPGPRTEHQHLEVRSALPLRAAAAVMPPPFAIPGDSPGEAARAVFRCGPWCFFGTAAQPLAAARLTMDLRAMDAIAEHVRYVPDGSLGAGALRAQLDIAQIARVEGGRGLQQIAAMVPALHLEARVEGPSLAGAIGFSPQLPFTVPPLRGGERHSYTAEQLRCLEEVELGAVATANALRAVDPAQHSQLLQAGRAEASASLPCVTDPALRREADAYLEALDAIAALTAPPAPQQPQDLTP